jgi:D-alanyl-lipoteichoic acid acyltransferase DltB (MBOAT superfamily)
LLFNSFTYLLFLPGIVALYWAMPERFRRTLLLVASYIFYMNWMPAYGLLILALTSINYGLGLAIHSFQSKRKLYLTLGLVFNVGCLCFFKYANFLLESFLVSIHWLGKTADSAALSSVDFPMLNIILPLGISFFTFEFIHYIVDIYRGSKPVKNFFDFALFAAFFPSQIAGPIKRFQDFMLQLDEKIYFKSENFRAGIFLILQGLYKKVVLGDNLGILVGHGFTHIQNLGTLDAWLAVAGFQFQIFFDFSGYTDIGRGSALLFGYKVPENFDWPFISANLTEFWRRWHMSLSTWLRDYLFIPLGGSRCSPWMVRRNMMLTMVIGGLWHGAAWHYVVWGAFHGFGLVLSKDWHDYVSRFKLLSRWRESKIWHCAGVVCTMIFLFIAGTIFRAENLQNTLAILARCVTLAPAQELTTLFLSSTFPTSLAAYLVFLSGRVWFDRNRANLSSSVSAALSWWDDSLHVRAITYATIALVILGFAPGKIAPFIYFQF